MHFFIYDYLLKEYYAYGFPFTFVSFGCVEAKMYHHFRRENTFILPNNHERAYGAIFYLDDAAYYLDILDRLYFCSKVFLKKNHIKDTHHRVEMPVIPIHFNTLDDLARLKYVEQDPMTCQVYIGNENHPNIIKRLNKTNTYRVKGNIDAPSFTHLYYKEANA